MVGEELGEMRVRGIFLVALFDERIILDYSGFPSKCPRIIGVVN